MKFRLTEQIGGFIYNPKDPELQGYELELDAYEIYDRLIEEFGLEKLADLLIENGFCNEATQNEMKDADEGYLAEIVMDTITGDNIYNLLGVDEFRDIICFACSHFVFGAQCYMQAQTCS